MAKRFFATVIFATLAAFTQLSCAKKDIYPPYYFSADLSTYPKTIEREKLSHYLKLDKIGDEIIFIDSRRIKDSDKERIYKNINIENIDNVSEVSFGYTIRAINMRMMPSAENFHRGNKDFDFNQYTRLGAFSPVAILHQSLDKKFYYVQSESMRGWLPADSVAIYDGGEFANIMKLPYLRVVKDNFVVGGIKYNIGDKIPFVEETNASYKVLTPANTTINIKKSNHYILGDAEYSHELIKQLAESQLGNPYDWGGKRGFRDCSAYVRDIWLVFGKDLPRNSLLQSKVGRELVKEPASKEDFFKVLDNASAFKTLIFLKGHVMIFGGIENDDYVIYHAANRIVLDNGREVLVSSVVKNKLKKDKLTEIWKRVVKVTQLEW